MLVFRSLFQATSLRIPGERQPTRQAISHLLRLLREDGILNVIREGAARRPQGSGRRRTAQPVRGEGRVPGEGWPRDMTMTKWNSAHRHRNPGLSNGARPS